jgi:hypothetical protein
VWLRTRLYMDLNAAAPSLSSRRRALEPSGGAWAVPTDPNHSPAPPARSPVQFVAALEEGLRPRLALAGDTASLDAFAAFFAARKLPKGTVLTLVYRPDAVLEVALRAGQVCAPGCRGAVLLLRIRKRSAPLALRCSAPRSRAPAPRAITS